MRIIKQTTFFLISTLLLMTIFTIRVLPTHAVTAADWRAGNIIDDSLFYNGNDMSTAEIQSFLNSKVPTCDTNGSKIYSGNQTRAQYGASRGYPAPYICLKNYSMSVPGYSADSYCSAISAGTKSAAQIIRDVASACGIGSKVMLVLLQKEQSLITDDWPWPNQYQKATGFACPDTAPCDSQYSGFFNQVYRGARQYKIYKANPDNYRYKPRQNNPSIQFNPNASCGSSGVYIENDATAGLYIYTPYQPNQAALNNLYGTGDNCSAYGNRNFWRMYSDWFGSVRGTPFFAINGKVYIEGASNSYYYVPDPATLSAYGVGRTVHSIGNVSSSYTQGKVFGGNLPRIARFDDNKIYAFDGGDIHHFQSEAVFNSYGYQFGQEAVLPSSSKGYFISSSPMANVVKRRGTAELYSVQSGKKRHIGNETAFNSLGSPIYSTQPSVTLGQEYLATISNGTPVLVNGSLVQTTDTGKYGILIDNVLYGINPQAARDWGLNISYKNSSSIISLFPQSPNQDLTRFVKAVSGELYILDSGRKLYISNGEWSNLGLSAEDFPIVPTLLLSKFSNGTMTPLVMEAGTSPVYAIRSGQRYHISSEADLIQLGYSWSQLVKVKAGTLSLFQNSGKKLFHNGKLIRVNNRPEVYIVDGNFSKRHIPNEDIFIQYGFNGSMINTVSQFDLDSYTSSSSLRRYAKDGAGTYWLVDSGIRRQMSSQALLDFGLTDPSFITVTPQVLARLNQASSVTNVMQPKFSNRVYRVQNGQKRWITTEQAFVNGGYSWSNVRSLSKSLADSIPNGQNITE